jgi:hypothetical protein
LHLNREAEKKNMIVVHLIIFVFSLYLITASLPQFFLADQSAVRYEVTVGIVEKHDLAISNGHGVQGKDGRYYSYYGLGWSVLAVPFYMVGKFIGRDPEPLVYLMQLLAGAVTVAVGFLFCISLGYSNRSSLFASLFYGFGSMAWPLAKQPFEHVAETLFVLLSVYFLYLFTLHNKITRLILSAAFLGIALNIRLTSILVVPALILIAGVSCSKKGHLINSNINSIMQMIIYVMVLLPFIGILLWYNYYRFGSIYETGFQLIATKTGIDFFTGTSILTGLRGFLLSPGKGIFYYSPVALLFFPAILPFYKKNPRIILAFLAIISSYLLFLAKNIYWHGDWSWGPRYLLVILPFLIIPVVELLETDKEKKKSSLRFAVIYGIFVLGVVLQVAAVSVDCCKYFFDLQLGKNIEFIVNKGIGVPEIVEPPQEVHFDWEMSPIIARFQSIYDMGRRIKNYRHVDLPENTPLPEKIKAYPPMNIYDFWWVYMYYINGIRTGFLVVAALGGICIISGYRLITISRCQV